MTDLQDRLARAEMALAERLAPKRGTVACQVPDDIAQSSLGALYAGPCGHVGTSVDAAARHLDGSAVAAERKAGDIRKGRASRTGHRYVAPARAALRERERLAVGTIRAQALITDD